MAEITNSIIRAGHSFRSTTAVATPSAFSATEYRAFASTVSGAVLMGYGTTGDVTLKNRAGTSVLWVGPDTTTTTLAGALVCGGAVSGITSAILDQGADDGAILSLRSSDVAHGMTNITDTSTYGYFQKHSFTTGGLKIVGLSESTDAGVNIVGVPSTGDTTKSNAAIAAVQLIAVKKNGATTQAMGANENILAVFADASTVRFILDADGDSHQDVGTAWTNFDTHDDVALLNLLSAHVTRRRDPLRKSFVRWLERDRDVLERAKLVTFNRRGHHFVNMSRLAMLHTGALRQLGARLARTERRLARAEKLLAA